MHVSTLYLHKQILMIYAVINFSKKICNCTANSINMSTDLTVSHFSINKTDLHYISTQSTLYQIIFCHIKT